MSFTVVKSPPISQIINLFHYFIPKPLYHPSNKDCVIISTDYEENYITPGIYIYNIVQNEFQIIHKYNNTNYSEKHGQFIDPSNHTLILYGGKYDTFKIFDLNTNRMKPINDKNIISKCSYWPQNAFIPSPINHIHMLDKDCNHYKLNIRNKETIEIETNSELKSHHIQYPKLLYIKLFQQLYVFGG
eukprot:323924_1